MAAVGLPGTPARPVWGMRPDAAGVVFFCVFAAVALVVVYPVWLLLVNSLQVGDLGKATEWGFDYWRSAFDERRMREAMVNTIGLTVASQAIAFVISIPVSFLIARTNIPFRGALEFGFWVAIFLPSLTVTLAWILLLDGHRGLLNTLVEKLPFVQKSPFDIFSWWGIVFMHVVTISTAIKVVILVPAFRNLDASLEEASLSLGASPFRTLLRIVIPILAPAILVVFLFGTIRSIQSFEIELILGAPRQIEVYSTLIYHQIYQDPPQYGKATVLSLLVLALLLPLIAVQHWLTHRRNYVTVSGKFSNRLFDLGAWRWAAFALAFLLCFITTILPFVMVMMGTFMQLFGFFNIPDPWTTAHWGEVFSDPKFFPSLKNTMVVGLGVAAITVTLFSVVAYVAVRSAHAARSALDFLTWLPSAIPGVVIGLGMLWMFLETPVLKSLYGSPVALVAAVAVGTMTLSVQVLKTNIIQLGAELEEASRAHGASWPYTFRRIVLPLLAPAFAAVAILAFGSAAREVSLVALLSNHATQPLSMFQLSYVTEGRLENASVVGVLIMLMSVGVAVVGRMLGVRSI